MIHSGAVIFKAAATPFAASVRVPAPAKRVV